MIKEKESTIKGLNICVGMDNGYLLEKFLDILVVPNYSSIWHFESKIAQSYLFQYAGITTPRTLVSFDYDDTLEQLDCLKVPFVTKKFYGSASAHVRLIK